MTKFDKCMALALNSSAGENEAIAAFLAARRIHNECSMFETVTETQTEKNMKYTMPKNLKFAMFLLMLSNACFNFGGVTYKIDIDSETKNGANINIFLKGKEKSINQILKFIDNDLIPHINKLRV